MIEFLKKYPPQLKSSIIIIIFLIILIIIVGFKMNQNIKNNKETKLLILLEAFVNYINNFVRLNIGRRWKFFSPFILTFAIYLIFANTASLFGLVSPTSNVSVNAGLASSVFLLIQYAGISSNGLWGYIKDFFSPIFLLLPLNIISEFTFPLTLDLRLFGNLISGEVLGTFITDKLGYFSIVPMVLFNIIFNIAFALIQVLVFVNLAVIFISMKIKDEEKYYIEE